MTSPYAQWSSLPVRLIVAMWSLVVPATLIAQASSASSCGGLQIFSVNGILTDTDGATNNARRIESMLQNDVLLNNRNTNVQAIYNPDYGFLVDLENVFAQKIDEGLPIVWSDFLDWIAGELDNSTLNDLLKKYLATDGAQKLEDLKTFLNNTVAFTDPTVTLISTTLQSKLAAGSTVLVVSHSQGNLYANAAYNALVASPNSTGLDLGAIGMAQIADPAASVATGDGYVTSATDLVIDGLLLLSAGNTLSPNDSSVPLFPSEDIKGHSLIDVYTSQNYPSIRQHVLNTIDNALIRLLNVSLLNTNGPLTATLVWDIPGDVDLHTFEPSGVHVYYASRFGQAGSLDRDDTQGTGPEHYYTNNNTVTTGTYEFGVNYFAGNSGGDGPRKATVHVCAAGVDYPSRSIVLPTPLGTSGDASPSILFNVTLTKNQDGSLSATIQ